MDSTRSHICVFFDDGDLPEHLCGCGRRALSVVDDEETAAVLIRLADETATVTALVTGPSATRRDYAVSA